MNANLESARGHLKNAKKKVEQMQVANRHDRALDDQSFEYVLMEISDTLEHIEGEI